MATYKDVMTEMGPPPEAPGDYRFLGWKLNNAAQEAYERERRLYDAEALTRLQQQLNPLRHTTLGEISELTNTPADKLATPDQYTSRTVEEPSIVPSYRYVPTMTNEPSLPPIGRPVSPGLVPRVTQLQGPPDLRQGVEPSGELGPLEEHYPHRVDMVPQYMTPRPGQGPSGPAPIQPQVRPLFQRPIGELREQEAPPVTYQRREVDPSKPSNLFQQTWGLHSFEREEKWPRSYGAGGNVLFNTKLQARARALQALGYDDALRLATLELTGGTEEDLLAKRENLRQRTETGEARQADLESSAKYRGLNYTEKVRQNTWMNDYRNRLLEAQKMWHSNAQRSMDQKDELGWARLNEARWWHDQMMLWVGALDKAGMLSDEQQQAAQEALSFIERMQERPLRPDEVSRFKAIREMLGLQDQPRYQYQPRPPLGPTGGPPPMGRQDQFKDAPPGAQVGDKLNKGGKPVATWDGKAWQPIPTTP